MHDLNNFLEKQLTEGVKFGQKQISDILSRSGDFNIGVEYEIRPTHELKSALLDQNFKDSGLDEYGLSQNIHTIITEHDSMVEIITKKMSLSEGLKHIKNMFRYLTDKDIEVPEMAGMHISVSTNKYALDKMNFLKFYLLMDTDFIHKTFPPRDHVHNSINHIKNSIYMWIRENDTIHDKKYSNSKITTRKLKEIEKNLLNVFQKKYQTINIGDYILSDGRIELRFFGGEDYHTMYDDIKLQLLRALFLMELAYTDLYQKEYYQELGKIILDITTADDTDKEAAKESTMKLLQDIKEENGDKILNRMETGHLMFSVHKIPSKIKEKIKKVMAKKPEWATRFAALTQERFIEAEKDIKNDAKLAVHYALSVLKGRFEEAEDVIFAEDSYSLSLYVRKVFAGQRLPKELEEKFAKMSTNGYAWYNYANRLYSENIISGPKEAQEELPLLNTDALLDLTSRYALERGKLTNIVTFGILNERNINEFIKAIAYGVNENISSGAVTAILDAYFSVFGSISVEDDIREKALEKSYQFYKYFDKFTEDDKIAYVTSFYVDLKEFMRDKEFNAWDGIAKSIINKAVIMKPLFPLTDEFKKKFKDKTGIELPKDLVNYEE